MDKHLSNLMCCYLQLMIAMHYLRKWYISCIT